MNKSILYLGNFSPKTSFAALNRALGICKLFKEFDYESHIVVHDYDTVFLNDDYFVANNIVIHDFEFKKLNYYFSSKACIELIKKIQNLELVILYNYPYFPSVHILKYCRKHNIKVLGDITEWYDTSNVSLLFKPIKFYDTETRMKKLNYKLDGLIVISNYLLSYYNKVQNIIKIYPLMDYAIRKKAVCVKTKTNNKLVRIGYAGIAGRKKDDLISFANLLTKGNVNNIELSIVGIINSCTEKKLKNSGIVYRNYGLLKHDETINILSNCDCQVIYRNNSRMNNAGFPTKFAESMAIGIPTIVSGISDLPSFSSECVFVVENNPEELANYLRTIKETKPKTTSDVFYSDNYIYNFKNFISSIKNS